MMKTTNDVWTSDHIVGAIGIGGQWSVLAAPIGEWRWQHGSGMLSIGNDGSAAFNRSRGLEVTQELLDSMLCEDVPVEDLPWLFVVADFSKRLFVNGFHDLGIERTTPPGWTGMFADPMKYVPDQIREWWSRYPDMPHYAPVRRSIWTFLKDCFYFKH